jgi:hypothetical protein
MTQGRRFNCSVQASMWTSNKQPFDSGLVQKYRISVAQIVEVVKAPFRVSICLNLILLEMFQMFMYQCFPARRKSHFTYAYLYN